MPRRQGARDGIVCLRGVEDRHRRCDPMRQARAARRGPRAASVQIEGSSGLTAEEISGSASACK
jgi:hypothetical protein